jgi:hypothetical protein
MLPERHGRGPAVGVIAIGASGETRASAANALPSASSEALPDRESNLERSTGHDAAESLPDPPALKGLDVSMPDQTDASRFLDLAEAETKRLDAHSNRLRASLPAGPPDGSLGPEGPPAKIRQERTKRQQRWTMIFNTKDGNDYVRQLKALGAILAVPQADGKYRVIRNLGERPANGKVEDLTTINRICWIDEKTESIQGLSKTLGIAAPPKHIVAFFPEKLEKELLTKELAFAGRNEQAIYSTQFQITATGKEFEPKVVSQTPAR